MPVIVALTEWADRWVGDGPITYTHHDCGGHVHQHVRCNRCGEDVQRPRVTATPARRARDELRALMHRPSQGNASPPGGSAP